MLKGKVLIVEDQPNFRRGLRKMLEDAQLGWSVVGEASNGKDALELLEQVQPDLVLTDIRMPVMDGLEFIAHLRQSYPELIVIILTGYKNFEYAQAAIRLGALDLLIKPCTEDDVRTVMGKASERFYEKYAEQQQKLGQLRIQQNQELRAALLDLPYSHGAEKSLEGTLDGKELWLLQMNSEDLAAKGYGKSDLGLIQFALSNIAEELLAGAGVDARVLLMERDRFVIVADAGGVNEQLQSAIQAASAEYLKLRTSFLSIGAAPPVKQLAECYSRFKDRSPAPADASSVTGEQGVGGTGAGASLSLNQAKVQQLESQLMTAILTGQEDHLQQLLEDTLKELSDKPLEEMKLHALSLSLAMLGTMRKEFEADDKELQLSGLPHDLPQWNAEEVIGWARGQIDSFQLMFNQWKASKSDNFMERAVKYIEEHYHEECRLTDVAAHVHLNASYFSVLFKKATGESFTRYVNRVRMEKGALLLRNTDMKIFEIATAIGFDEPNYFTNVFKQHFGVSPKEYRSEKN